jgi:dTMP kinase
VSARGRLISIEGIDGVGKTTHAGLLLELLHAHGVNAVAFREPGGTPLGEQLRRLLKDSAERTALSELLLFAAARAELVETRIKPALADGTYVLLDRFTDSTLAYQGALGGIAEDELHCVCRICAAGLTPDLTFWLDLDPSAAQSRNYPLASVMGAAERAAGPDVIEQRDASYFRRVHERYLQLYASEPERIMRIDAGSTVEATAALIARGMELKLKEWRHG